MYIFKIYWSSLIYGQKMQISMDISEDRGKRLVIYIVTAVSICKNLLADILHYCDVEFYTAYHRYPNADFCITQIVSHPRRIAESSVENSKPIINQIQIKQHEAGMRKPEIIQFYFYAFFFYSVHLGTFFIYTSAMQRFTFEKCIINPPRVIPL